MADTNEAKFKELRKAFPKESVGLLPKPYKKDSPKGNCKECGGYHGLPAVHLDFVGHAAVTDRLLQVDPSWSWEPMATDEAGLPMTDRAGNLWIKLTVLGVTRIGVGDGNNAKECIGDALRNAAMRFGIALDLWSKNELESHLDEPENKNEKPSASVQPPAPKQAAAPAPIVPADEPAVDDLAQLKRKIIGKMEDQNLIIAPRQKAFVVTVLGKSSIDTTQEAEDVLEALRINEEQ